MRIVTQRFGHLTSHSKCTKGWRVNKQQYAQKCQTLEEVIVCSVILLIVPKELKRCFKRT
ncbi:hypothetical protein BDB00DRAFT_823003 [Zychaea mexicana]|uniref:uncharacterized protein n=1 Tax=Zychaea mexicana TaxID=64656 RepID=UPI0022FE8A7E|nr:uncharacterized protein BDB00DRAFT_823003 [Zychaea mexicana]KAI9493428.1 hypothetical protein BDB00DRAFT_823003 [Zychaea mexicana]